MNILIVEDDFFKYSKIIQIIKSTRCDIIIERCDNVHAAVKYVKSNNPDKIILDMSLPSHAAKIGEGSPIPMPAGGVEILLELTYRNKGNIPVLILTQYEEIEIEDDYYSIDKAGEELENLYGFSSVSVSLYDNDINDWHSNLKEFIGVL
ncbi:response regulator [Pantoea dispersa]|uniref:response regulator n=1 Tax=Pantoea dispersa TaxID=59814 RepID=UPI0039B3CE0F